MDTSSFRRVKQVVRSAIPATLWHKITLKRVERTRRSNLEKSTQQVFTEVYAKNLWGGETGEFYSGSGSDTHMAEPYIQLIRSFIQENDVRTVVDLGCGDFRIGRHIAEVAETYIGIDIVESLIERNRVEFGSQQIAFLCLDVINDELPQGDLCLIRQVLQHLSNQQIKEVLSKIKQYRYAIITEHYPASSVAGAPNIDKPHGPDTRLYNNSAVYLDQPPFNVPGVQTLLVVEDPQYLIAKGQTLRTMLVQSPKY